MSRLAVLALLLAACGDNNNPSADALPPDSGDPLPPVPLERAHAGGNPGALAIVDGRAYLGTGPRLAIWDLASGTLVGESAPLRGNIGAVAVVGTRAFVAERLDLDAKLHVLDITDPSAIVETKLVDLATSGFSVIHDLEPGPNDRLYVSDQEQGVFELDITDPDEPSPVRLAPLPGVGQLQLSGTRLYYWNSGFIGTSLGALDTTMNLKDLGQTSVPVHGLAMTGNLAVGAGHDGIYVFDVSNLNNPLERFHFSHPEGGPFARAVAARGSRAWIPADDGLHVLDLSRPAQIARQHFAHDVVGVNVAATTDGALAIATDRGQLHTFDVTEPTPSNPRTLDVTLCADCVGVAALRENTTVYITDIVGGLRTAKLTDLVALGRSPAIPAEPNTGGLAFVFEDVKVDAAASRAYVADWLFGLRIYDVANPAAITELGKLATAGAPSGVAIGGAERSGAFDGDRAYLSEGTGGGFVRAIDVSNPAAPVELGALETSKSIEIEVRGTLAYVADESLFGTGGLRIIDVSNPAQLVLLGTYDQDCTNARDLALVGASHAIVACGGDGFHLVDISNPAAPTRAAVIPAPPVTSAWSVAADGTRVVLGHDAGVIVSDVSNPATPSEIATYPTAFAVRAIAVPAAGRIVAVAGPAGVYQWQL